MKHAKRFLALLLTLCLLSGVTPAAQAFSDVSDFAESAAAESLASLGIVDSVDRFNPRSNLTRAQFCKIAVLAAGFDEQSLYSGYTIYPDVPASAWYAPYVNAAVRKYSMIKGDERGYFNPDQNITYGEAVTILLRMLGYQVADIGLMWPSDYVNKAHALGLDNAMQPLSASQAIPRGQAAILLCNTLLTENKEGTLFAAVSSSVGSSDSILLATSQVDPNLSANQAVVYLNGETQTYACAGTLSASLCGLRGLPVFQNRTQNRLRGFIADFRGAETETVKAVSSGVLTLESDSVTVPRDTMTVAGGLYGGYITCWFDIHPGDQVALYYNDSGVLDLISTRSKVSAALSGTYIYGVDDVVFGKNDRLVKNGAEIAKSDLQTYDVLSYSGADQTYYVSSQRITLLYQSGGPVYSNPSRVTAGNRTFSVSEQAGRYFSQSGIEPGSRMTLLFDYNGTLAAVMPVKKVTCEAVGVLRSLSDSSCTVELLSGMTLEGAPDFSGFGKFSFEGQRISSLYKLEGQLVQVSQNKDGTFALKAYKLTAPAGDLDVTRRTVGKYELADSIRVYECAARGMTLHEISLDDIPTDTVDSSKILHAERGSDGRVTTLVLCDVTGDRYIYGMVKTSSEKVTTGTSLDGEPLTRTQYTLYVRTGSGEQVYKTFFKPDLTSTKPGYVPAAVSADLIGDHARTYSLSTPSFLLLKAGTAARTDFDAYRGVRIGGSYIPLADDVVVYASRTGTFVGSLSEARANYTTFTVYLDRPADEGGIVRVILAE